MKNYWLPTPAKWRKIGDSLLAVSSILAVCAIADEWKKWIQLIVILTGVAGKFLTNFFGPDGK